MITIKILFMLCVLKPICSVSLPPVKDYYKPFIIGGENATDGQAPFQCSMQKNGRHFCGCAIISKRWLLSAAHCFVFDVKVVQILVGTNDLKSGGDRYKPRKFIPHELFNNKTKIFDIGIIQMDEIEFSEKVRPIKYTSNSVQGGVEVQAFGWGRLLKIKPSPSRFLQTIKLKTISNEECNSKVDNVHVSNLCTIAKKNEGLCSGDSGSTLVRGNELIGLASWIKRSCASEYPDGFTRISMFYDWIQSKINQ